ncbi:HEAT repeat domain-containing protein [Rhodohalobacter sp. 8-1]|uniref:HEAT repeat domain-containing protein n=1 Tax=Rhodohalobacter sp. 8-1 TaxID=3131972 RepID=UPI0030ED1BE3
MFAPIIFDFVETAKKRPDADDIVKKVTRRDRDIELFIKVVHEIIDILEGDDRQKLNWLIQHKTFQNYYLEKLNSSLKNNQLQGCVYYSKIGNIEHNVTRRLLKLSKSKEIKVVYGAAKGIQNSTNNDVRLISLINFFKRRDVTSLMLGEVLHIFYLKSDKEYLSKELLFKHLLLHKSIQKERKEIIIEYIAHHNLYEYSLFLHNYLKKLLYRSDNRSLIKKLIETLGELNFQEAAPLIRNYSVYPNHGLRLCCVEALNKLGGEENLVFVTNMLMDMEFDVRKRVIQSLVEDSDNGHLLLEKFMLSYLRFLSKVWENDMAPKDMLTFLNKLRSTTNGIRITSANKTKRFKNMSV